MQPSTEQAAVNPTETRAALQRILSSPEFSRSPQLQRLLTFVVHETLAGRSERLKEYTIGVEVFARPASYDPRLDSLVRVEANRLRALLRQYYETSGQSDPVHIELLRGSYVPHFEEARTAPTGKNREWIFSGRSLVVAVSAVVLLLVAGLAWVAFKPAHASPNKTIAVLPFENLSSDPENAFLCFGLMDEITTNLAKHGHLRVIARTSASQFKRGDDIATIARRLKADTVLEGSVSKAGDHVRITVQLINAVDSVHLWAESYERNGGDFLAIQNEASREIARAVAHRLDNGELQAQTAQYSPNPEANRLYWKGAYFRAPIGSEKWRDNLQKSASFFRQAIAQDEGFANAYAALADVCATLAYESGGSSATVENMTCAREAANRALGLDPNISEAYAVLATVQFSYDYDHATAERNFQRALTLNPSDARAHMWYAVALAPQGRFEEALAQARQARELDPLSFATSNHLASVTYFTRRYDEASRLARETLETDSRIAPAHAILGMVAETKGAYGEAIDAYHRALQIAPNHPFITGRLGHALASANRREEARNLIQQVGSSQPNQFSDLYIAYMYLGLGEPDAVFAHLEQAYLRRDPDLPFVAVDPIFDPVRSDPRFHALLLKIGLPPAT